MLHITPVYSPKNIQNHGWKVLSALVRAYSLLSNVVICYLFDCKLLELFINLIYFSKDKLIHFIRSEMPRRPSLNSDMARFGAFPQQQQSFLSSYLNTFNFVELRLGECFPKRVGTRWDTPLPRNKKKSWTSLVEQSQESKG